MAWSNNCYDTLKSYDNNPTVEEKNQQKRDLIDAIAELAQQPRQ